MANARRSGSSVAASNIEDKENARPNERRIAVRRKLSFAGCEAPRRDRARLAANDERKNEPTGTLFGQAFAVRKTPFHVHRDERNAAGAAPRRQPPVPAREVEGKPGSDARKRSLVRSDANHGNHGNDGNHGGGSCPCAQPGDCTKIRPSKIPRRTRCASVPPKEDASGTAARRATSVENAADRPGSGSTTAKGIVEIGRAAAARTRSARGETLERRPADATIVVPRGYRRTDEASRNASTPLDGAPPPPVQKFPPKVRRTEAREPRSFSRAGSRPATESKPIQSDRAKAGSLYLVEYNECTAAVELEREERSPRLSDRFLSERVNPEQRRLVVVFLLRLGTHCRYPSSVVYQAAKLFDVAVDRIRVETRFVQLTALASLWISLKRLENFRKIPSATTMVDLAKELYAGREDLLIAHERAILRELNFNVTFADPYTLFAHHLINCGRCVNASEDKIAYLYHCGCYAIDVTLVDEQFCRTPAGLLAATIAELVLGLGLDADASGTIDPRWLFWRGLLFAAVPGLPRRFQDAEIDLTRVAVSRRLLSSGTNRDGFDAVYRKYNRSRYGRVSESFLKRIRRAAVAETLFDP